MNLHLDKDSFRVLIEDIHTRTGYRTDVLEKDYYVTLILEELSKKQLLGLQAYFKGGTALYKALKTTNRFSEDIDISVDTRGCSRTQNEKRLEEATKKYQALTRDVPRGKTNRSEVVSFYNYSPVTGFDANDALQRFGLVKIEATSFTISEPVENLEITPLIFDLATDMQKILLRSNFGIFPFTIKTITLERIFIDKLFAAESYVARRYEQQRAFEAAKHIYDLAVLEKHPRIINLMHNPELLENLLRIRIEEEKNRLDGIPYTYPDNFKFVQKVVSEASNDGPIRYAYEIMQRQYVFRSEDRIDYRNMCQSLISIFDQLEENDIWRNYSWYVHKEEEKTIDKKRDRGGWER